MSIEAALVAHYRAVRERLTNPPNAVPDPWRKDKQSIWQVAPIPIEPNPIQPEPPAPEPLPSIPEPTPLRGGLTFSSTLQVVAEDFGLTPQDLIKRGRKRDLSVPRQIAMYFGCKQGRTLQWVGKYFNRDHTTCLYARQKVSSLMAEDLEFANRVQNIEAKLNALHQSPVSDQCQRDLAEELQRGLSKSSV